ncbi:MAG: GNAT family N-acetyltransferase [Lachnospiraceae bacterium]|nr:GNAT family N-acetyltransferase [Lachnospiraceae bacterium]
MEIRIIYTNGKNADFISLCKKLDLEADALIGTDLRKEFHIDNHLDVVHDVFVAYFEYKPIACAGFKDKGEKRAEVKRVFTEDGFRCLGISKKLMRKVEEEAKKQGYQELVLESSKELVNAIKMYQKLGYQEIEKFYPYENSTISICMGKKI